MKKILFLVVGLFLCHTAYGAVPNLFANDTVADAILVNENYDYFEIKFSTTGGHDHDGSDSKAITVLDGLISISTITTGGWQATIIDEVYGGTGQSAYATGDLIYGATPDSVRILPAGTAGKFLQTGGTSIPSWQKVDLAAGTDVTGVLGSANGGITGTTAGGFLAGTYPNPTLLDYASLKEKLYFESSDFFDQTEILAFGRGRAMTLDNQEESYLGIGITWTSLAVGDLVAGKVSRECYDFDGTNDYALIAHDASQAGAAAITFEAWVYRDTAGNIDSIFANVTNDYLFLYMTNTNIVGRITGNTGGEDWDVAHGLSGNGIDQWTHILVSCTLGSAADIYVNGVDVGDGDGTGSGTVSDSTNGINIGADEAGSNKFHGKIDGVRILIRAMSAADMVARYNAFK